MATVVQAIQVHAKRVYDILDMPERLQNAPDAVDLPEAVRGEIEFRNVSLQYAEGGPFAVQGVDLTIPAGKTICLVGPTGFRLPLAVAGETLAPSSGLG